MASLEELRFDNRAIKSLPVEEERENYTRSVSGTVCMYGVFKYDQCISAPVVFIHLEWSCTVHIPYTHVS